MLSITKAMRPDLLKITLLLGLCCQIQALQAQALPAQASSLVPLYRSTSERLIEQALQSSTGFDRLALMCDRFGSRFSGSESLEQAIDWAVEDTDLLAIRSSGAAARTLMPMTDEERTSAEWLAYGGVVFPLILVVLWPRMRRRRVTPIVVKEVTA